MDMVILISMILGALGVVLTRSLLRAAIALAFTSAVVSILMFKLQSPLAALFELSVCTGLISVLFISTISLTYPLTREEVLQHMRERLRRFRWLPYIVVIVGVALSFLTVRSLVNVPAPEVEQDARIVLWNMRELDIIGQVIILLAGVFGVIILFREGNKK